MLTIIHGSDTTQSRKYFLDEKQKVKDAVLLEAEKVNLTDLTQILEGGGLFGETKYLFIEHLLTKRKKSSDFKNILSYLEKSSDENFIVLWEGKELERGTTYLFKKAVMRDFKLPQTLFQLLDAIKPGNGEMLIKLFHQTLETTETEMVFFMLVRQMRLLLALSNQNSKAHDTRDTPTIDELKRMQSWQQGKLQKQANLFELDHLLALYDRLFHIEVGQKTGKLNSSLISTIDFFLLEV